MVVCHFLRTSKVRFQAVDCSLIGLLSTRQVLIEFGDSAFGRLDSGGVSTSSAESLGSLLGLGGYGLVDFFDFSVKFLFVGSVRCV